ncbi:MerR family transcriptional regulator [Ferrovum myxofaciens]|uniref:MerR family regulatory protein n=1 Tax=Ferrovum myxofaciens TaxID=416213 RepID=A0A8F3DZS6_9PROT|nr:MerR family transcriptional regulator [Ferrovum myxofaciens]MBW8028996.1 MerR family transcriptional regulator [Ferrovum sp.]KXW57923.1 MerR family regulatory protein [Ferrovum myxofaciens]MBU6994127.1 MerR family transcriptional regulator [Ferrovum myxofaciens]NDU90674.1 MerR family transcriptional regulator [Ferrovum sp.]QKE38069.1 MAG: MerR family transcriptional regulator [Ferrovum myxofaciens]
MVRLQRAERDLPPIPPKHYFTIGEVSQLCDIKPHVLRYWEQEFLQLRQVKRRGNRRYYQPREVELIRHIRSLLYERGFTITGARHELSQLGKDGRQSVSRLPEEKEVTPSEEMNTPQTLVPDHPDEPSLCEVPFIHKMLMGETLRAELNEILLLLSR